MSSFLGGGGGSGGGVPGQLQGPVYDSNYNYLVPTAGATINLNNTDYQVILDPATAIESLNLIMPPAPFDGQIMEFSASRNISGFAMLPNAGQTVLNSPDALADGSPVFAIYRAADATWYVTAQLGAGGSDVDNVMPVTAVAGGTYTTTATDQIIVATATPATINLLATPVTGQDVIVKNGTNGGTVTTNGNGHTIDGAASASLVAYESRRFNYNGTEWSIL
jgi:hypothetical protein